MSMSDAKPPLPPARFPEGGAEVVVKRNQSKYDFVKVRVWVGDHFYVLSRYLVCRALVSTKVRFSVPPLASGKPSKRCCCVRVCGGADPCEGRRPDLSRPQASTLGACRWIVSCVWQVGS